MSEFAPVEDPEPPSGGLQEFINNSIVLAGVYKDDGLAAQYRELEHLQHERIAVGALCVQAETLFKLYQSSGDAYDQTIRCGDVSLRRRREIHSTDGRDISSILYFFNDNRDGAEYCRVWTNASERVNWCYNEKRHELASEVQAHLQDAFPPKQMAAAPRRFGRMVLPRIIRQKI